MTIGLLFWIVFVIGVLVTGWLGRPFGVGSAPGLILLVLLFLLGWSEFGFIIRG